MSLYLTYIQKTDLELMTILESPEDYTKEALEIINEIFQERRIEGEDLRALAIEANKKKIEDIFLQLDPLNDEIKPHTSDYLDSAEIKEMYKEILKEHMSRKDGFKFNVWLYAIGG